MVRHAEMVQRRAPANTALYFSSKGTLPWDDPAVKYTFPGTQEWGKRNGKVPLFPFHLQHLKRQNTASKAWLSRALNSPHTEVKEEKRNQHDC